MSSHGTKCTEVAQSAQYARALDRFLFDDSEMTKGACFHQLPVVKKQSSSGMEQPDLYVAKLVDGCAHYPVLLCDVKKANLTEASIETWGYCCRAMEIRHRTDQLTLNLGLAIAEGRATLMVLVGDDGFVRVIDICTVSFSDPASTALFCVLRGAVHNLCEKTIEFDTSGMHPFKDTPTPLTVLDKYNGKDSHVFRDTNGGMVYKLYDSEHCPALSPNYHVITSIKANYLPELSLQDLTDDKRVQCLKYRFIEGSCCPNATRSFVCIVNDLEKLSDSGYVHGDIRQENLVFNGDHASIIDFDMAGHVGDPYPSAYNHIDIPERHWEARAGMAKKTEHDVFALSVIMEGYFKKNVPKDLSSMKEWLQQQV